MNSKKLLAGVLTTVLLSTSIFTGCGGSKTNSTASTGNITLDFFNEGNVDKHGATGDLWMWKEYAKKTGVNVKWRDVSTDALNEKKNLALVNNDMPDVFYGVDFSQDDIVKYGKSGTFVKLDTLIDKYAPNLKKYLKDNPSVKKALTMPDGHIYTLPLVESATFYGNYYINKKWLDKLGLKVPTTLDELYDVLVAFKTKDPNGNGKADEVPYYPWGKGIDEFSKQLLGSFGVGNRGARGIKYFIDADENGNVRFIPSTQGFEDSWKFIAKMWKAGLMSPEFFSGVDENKWQSDLEADRVGMTSWVGAPTGDKQKDFVGISAFKGPNGDQIMSSCSTGLDTCRFAITKHDKNLEQTMKWVDYFYSKEGADFLTFGKEGETYNVKNGKKVYVDKILNYKDGPQLGAFQFVQGVYGGNYPMIEPDYADECAAQGQDAKTILGLDPNQWKQYAPKERWNYFNPTPEESAELKPIVNDITNYISEQRVKFITGQRDFDKDWKDFLNTLDKLGAKQYLKVKQQQYDRYKKS